MPQCKIESRDEVGSLKAVDFAFIARLAFDSERGGLKRRSVENRMKIISAATDAFMVRSYDDVSTYEIAVAAGVAQSLVTYHFKSKEGLWQVAMDHLFGEFRNGLVRRIAELKSAELRVLLYEMIRCIVELELRYPSRIRLMVESANQSDGHMVWLVDRHVRPIYQVITHILKVGRENGVVRDLPIANAYYVLLASGAVFSIDSEIEMVVGRTSRGLAFVEDQVRCLAAMIMVDADDVRCPPRIVDPQAGKQGSLG